MPRIRLQSWHIFAALGLFFLFVWSLSMYYQSTHAGVQGSGSVALVASLDAYLADTLGLPHSTPTGNGLEEAPALVALLAAYDGQPFSLGVQTQSAGCTVAGALPDARCTPGAVFAQASTSDICVSGYSRSVRNVSVKTKRQIYAAYGIGYPQPTGSYEVDHLIPLELGGSNDVANLFPEAAEPTPGFHEKDLVENYLHDEVCAGVIDLAPAQEQIARDWLAVYNTLSPATIAALKRQAASFGD